MLIPIFIPESVVDLAKIADIIVIALGVVMLVVTPFIVKKLAPWLRKKGWDDEVLVFLQHVDGAFDFVEEMAKKTPTASDEKLLAMLRKLAEDLERELGPEEVVAATARAARTAARDKVIRAGGSLQLDGPGIV